MSNQIGDKPIDPDLVALMNGVAKGIDDVLNGATPGPKHNGFILMVFPFEGHEGRCNYISNACREDVVVLLKEQLARFQGQPEVSGRA